MMFINDIISISVVGFFMFPFLKFAETKQLKYLVFGFGIILVDCSTKVIKYYTKDLHDLFRRPLGAYDCDIFCRNKLCEGNPGFPSGHSTVMAFFTTFIYLNTRNISFTTLNILLTILVSISRYQKQCHNEFQIISGIMYGCACGFLFNEILKRYIKI